MSGDGGVPAEKATVLPVARSAPSRSGLGFRTIGGDCGGDEPRTLCPAPHLPLYCAMRWGPQTMVWLDAPIRALDQGPRRPLGRLSGDQPNIALLQADHRMKGMLCYRDHVRNEDTFVQVA